MLVLPQRQRFQSLEKQEGVERAERRANITQQGDARLEDERHVAHPGNIAQRVPIDQPVVTGIRRRELGELAIVPLELARIDDHAADRRAVSADVLRRRGRNDVRAEVKRPHQAHAHRVVHH